MTTNNFPAWLTLDEAAEQLTKASGAHWIGRAVLDEVIRHVERRTGAVASDPVTLLYLMPPSDAEIFFYFGREVALVEWHPLALRLNSARQLSMLGKLSLRDWDITGYPANMKPDFAELSHPIQMTLANVRMPSNLLRHLLHTHAAPSTDSGVTVAALDPMKPLTLPESDRGRRMKRAALIEDNQRLWPTVERDLKDSATNGLHVAKDTAHGWWWEGAAQRWARERGKIESQSSAGTIGQLGAVHRIRH